MTRRPMEMVTPTTKDRTTHTDSTTTSAITVTQMLCNADQCNISTYYTAPLLLFCKSETSIASILS